MTEKTAIQRIKELDQEGLNYRLVAGTTPAGSKSAGKKSPETGHAGADKKRAARPQ